MIIIVIFSCDIFAQAKLGEKNWKSLWVSAQYAGMLYYDIPQGDGELTFKWSKNKMEKITGTFKGNAKGGGTVYNAKVDLIPEGCYYSGTLSYEIQVDKNKLVLNFISGILTINSQSYKVNNIKYVSDCYDKKYSLRDPESNSVFSLRVEHIDENELAVNWTDFLTENFPNKKSEQILYKKIGKPIKLQIEIGKKTINVIKENIIEERQNSPTSKVSSVDDEVVIHYNSKIGFMEYRLSDMSSLFFSGDYEFPHKFKVKKLTHVRLTLNDNTKIEGEKKNFSDLYSGKIDYNGNIFKGDFRLNLAKYNSITDYFKNATLSDSDVILEKGEITKKNGEVVVYKSPEVLAKEEAEHKAKVKKEKLAQQKADSIWNAIPLKKYSGPYQLTANESAKEGYATYFYREEKGQRVYEKGFNYQDNSIMISGEYKKGMKHGRWTYHLKEPNLKLEVDYKNGIRNGMYKCIVHNENGKQTLNMTLKMKNNFVVGIANFWKSWMFFNYKPSIKIQNAQIKATFSVDGRLDEISEITTTGSDAGRFKYCERWSFGSLLEKYYYNNMTGDRIDLERTSPIVDTIRELINEIFALTENKMPKGFNEASNAKARNLYYFHINWKLSDQGSTTAPEWDQNSRNHYDTMNFN